MNRTALQAALLAVALAALILGGCAGTPSRDAPSPGRDDAPGVLESLQSYQDPTAEEGHRRPEDRRVHKGERLARAQRSPPALSSTPEAPLPTREPARIMRIWVAPWEDAEGNLHGASHVYTELTPRRWHLDAADRGAAAPVLTPLQIEPRTAPQKPR